MTASKKAGRVGSSRPRVFGTRLVKNSRRTRHAERTALSLLHSLKALRSYEAPEGLDRCFQALEWHLEEAANTIEWNHTFSPAATRAFKKARG